MSGGFSVTEAIVLARREITDDTVRLDCYSRRYGRLTGYFRKARREKVFGAAPGSLGELSLRDPLGTASPLVSSFERNELLYREGMDLGCYWGALTILEGLYRLLPHREPAAGLFDTAVATLREIARGGRPAPLTIAFLLALLDAAGYRWRLERCRGCGRETDDTFLLVPEDGSLVCRSCRREGKGGVDLSPGAVAALRRLAVAPPSVAGGDDLPRPVAIECLRAFALGIPSHFDRRLESLATLAPRGRRLTGGAHGSKV